MRNLKVTLIQCDLTWHSIAENVARFHDRIKSIRDETDLIILPEMFTTGFTMTPHEVAEDMDGVAVKRLAEWAGGAKADIAGSISIREGGRYYNRLVWARPDGSFDVYDKRHLFRMAGEDAIYSSGDKRITIELNGWKLRPFICYDLRFPVWMRNTGLEYDAAIVVANWPEKRSHHWKALLQARAIENQSYVIGVNRVGIDGNGISYSGDSTVVDFAGNILFSKTRDACIRTIELSFDEMEHYRASFPAWKDADYYKFIEK